MSQGVPPGYYLTERISNFDSMIGPIYEKSDGENYFYGIRIEERHSKSGRMANGSLLFAILNYGLGTMAYFRNGNSDCTPITLNVDYILDVQLAEWIECSGEVVRETGALVFLKGDLHGDQGLVMTGTGIWKKSSNS